MDRGSPERLRVDFEFFLASAYAWSCYRVFGSLFHGGVRGEQIRGRLSLSFSSELVVGHVFAHPCGCFGVLGISGRKSTVFNNTPLRWGSEFHGPALAGKVIFSFRCFSGERLRLESHSGFWLSAPWIGRAGAGLSFLLGSQFLVSLSFHLRRSPFSLVLESGEGKQAAPWFFPCCYFLLSPRMPSPLLWLACRTIR